MYFYTLIFTAVNYNNKHINKNTMKHLLTLILNVILGVIFTTNAMAQSTTNDEATQLLKSRTTTEVLNAREIAIAKLPEIKSKIEVLVLKLKDTTLSSTLTAALKSELSTAKTEEIMFERIAKNRTPKEHIEILEKQLATGKMSDNQRAGIKVRIDSLKGLDK